MRGTAQGKARAAAALLLAMAAGLAWGEVIGRSLVALDGREGRLKECTLGDLAADAARAAVKADVALVQAGQLREAVIPAGDLERETVRSALLYPDEQVVLVEITGQKIRAALERGLSVLPQQSSAFLQVSGLQVNFRSRKAAGQRVEAITVGNKPLVSEKTYRVAMPASLAKGALGYFRIFNGLKVKQTGPALSQGVWDHVGASRAINLSVGERLRDLSQPPPS